MAPLFSNDPSLERDHRVVAVSGEQRNQIIDHLTQCYVADILDQREFERRIALVHEAPDIGALRTVIADLPAVAGSSDSSVHTDAGSPVADGNRRTQESFVAILGGSGRKGVWRPAAHTRAFALLGGVELDFREAELSSGVTEIEVMCVLGGVDIVVPPGVNVDVSGVAILGGFDNRAEAAPPGAPTIRVRGMALLGGVDVKTKTPKKRRK